MMNERDPQNILDFVIFLQEARKSLKKIENLNPTYKYLLHAMLEILIDEVKEKDVRS